MDAGVRKFFAKAEQENAAFFVSVITIGELRRGVEIIRHRGDYPQAEMLDAWLQTIIDNYAENILESGRVGNIFSLPAPFRYPDGGQNKKTFCPPYTANSGYPQRNDFIAIGVMLLNLFQKPGSLG